MSAAWPGAVGRSIVMVVERREAIIRALHRF